MPDPRSAVLELYDALNDRDFDRYAALLDGDVVATFDGSTLSGRAAVTDRAAVTVAALPSVRVGVEVLAEAPDLVVVAAGMLDGASARRDIRTLPGRSHEIFRVRGEQIVEIISSSTPYPEDPWRTEAARLIDEQAALRRVAELAAHDATSGDVLEAVVTEASNLVGVAFTMLLRFGPAGATEVVAIHDPPDSIAVGMRAPGGGDGSAQRVWRTGRTARVDRLAEMSDRWPRLAASQGYSASAAAPILAEDRLWGALIVCGRDPLPSRIEEQLSGFAELAGTAISSTQARADLQALADEQAALRRLAELIARDAEPQAVLDAVVNEASRHFGDAITALMRYGSDGFATVVAACRGPQLLGVRVPLESRSSTGDVARSRRPSRTDDYATSEARAIAAGRGVAATVSVPVIVEGAVWGSLTVGSADEPLPEGLEDRIAQFAGLVGTAVSSAHAGEQLQRLADEQAALLRVAERVARGDPPDEVFSTVAAEAQRLLGGQAMTLTRFEDDASLVVISRSGGPARPGTRIAFEPDTLPDRVQRAATAARVDDYRVERDAALAREFGLAAAVAAPIVAEGRVWGMLTATSADGPLPPVTEARLQRFANLVGTAVSNATSRAQLIASRARVLSTADEARRRLQRDLHDGAQQRLVQTVISLKLARQSLAEGDVSAGVGRVDEGLKHAERATEALRELVSGILPSTLTRKGLRGGVESLMSDVPLPVDAAIDVPRLPAEIETTAYFVVAEALTNVVKHAHAERAWVVAAVDAGAVRIEVGDDGVGGARAGQGSGLTGLFDRVEARGGRLRINSPEGRGTTIEATVPVGEPPAARAGAV